jgi:hypothetical protein
LKLLNTIYRINAYYKRWFSLKTDTQLCNTILTHEYLFV